MLQELKLRQETCVGTTRGRHQEPGQVINGYLVLMQAADAKEYQAVEGNQVSLVEYDIGQF